MLAPHTLHRLIAFSCLTALMALSAAPAGGTDKIDPTALGERWRQSIAARGLDPQQLDNPLALSDEMRDTAYRVAGQQAPTTQLKALQQYLFDTERFPFDYEARGTYTAMEAFERREGNCVSFTNLFIALGRSLGVPLRAALIRRGTSELDGDLVVVNTHMVAAYQRTDGTTIFDFSRSENRQLTGFFVLDDVWVTSVFLNNKGVEALRAGRYDEAIETLHQAVRLTPDFTPAFANLGVAYRRNDQPQKAFEIYQQALAGETRDATVLNNLASLLRSQGREEEAEAALRAANLKGATPFLLITRGDLEANAGNLREANKLYLRAQRQGPYLADPLVALARLRMRESRDKIAGRLIRRALRLDAGHTGARNLGTELGVELPPLP